MKEVRDDCGLVTERVALGEPLGDLQGHAASCARCAKVIAMPARIAAAHEPTRLDRRGNDPGLGFSARMTIGAQQRLVIRRRRRIAGSAAGAVAAAAVAAFVLTRSPAESDRSVAFEPITNPPVAETPVPVGDAELIQLVNLADTKRAMRREKAPWGRIQKPLAPYVKLVKGVEP
jgi:hypothetical protein